jgi:hypothetical protein
MPDQVSGNDTHIPGYSDAQLWRHAFSGPTAPDHAPPHPVIDFTSDPAAIGAVLRVLDALQTDELCPCNWNKDGETLDAKKFLAGDGLSAEQAWGTALACAVAARNPVVLREIAAEAADHLKPEAVEAAKGRGGDHGDEQRLLPGQAPDR